MTNPPTEPPSTEATTPAPDAGPMVSLYTNGISMFGFMLIAIGLLLLLTFGLFSVVVKEDNPYLGIVGYLILPMIFVGGLVIVPLGMLWKLLRLRRQARKFRISYRLPALDLGNPMIRRRFLIFLLFSIFVVLPVLAVSSYEGYHYTESTAFCGQVCHTVMEPEATAHAISPHARITCAECHIGSGASWFVKSKLSGLRQVAAVMLNTYNRPIPPAITELRPARETCEECHWPAKFFGMQYQENVHYSPDETNTRRLVRLLLKVGGADESIGRVEGIHMHMLVAGHIEYVASDPQLQTIPWVRYQMPDGKVRIFRSDGQPSDAAPPRGLVRRVDCMDCHNRGAHHFRPPQTAVDLWLNVNRLDPNLPFIKREAVHVLVGTYAGRLAAAAEIPRRIAEFYSQQYPEVFASRQAQVEQAGAAVAELYDRGFFPYMNVDWRTYPENIGHMISPGCFRCHDGLHLDQQGTPISSSCDTCHEFLNPVEGRPADLEIGAFQHSLDLSQHAKLRCNQCHDGGELRLCRDCHTDQSWLEQWGKGEFRGEKP